MKKYQFILLSVFLSMQVLSGCGGGEKPYSIIDRKSGPAQVTVYVEVPAGTSQSEMKDWAKEIESSESGGRPVMINFFYGGHSAENMIGSYQGGTFYNTR